MNVELISLQEVCSISMGQAPTGSSYNTCGEGWPLVAGPGDFRGDRVAVKKYTSAAPKLSAPGDIILGIRASIGARVWSDQEFALGRGVAGLRAGPRLDPNYLWHWLDFVAPRLAAKGRGATFLQVSRIDIAEMTIPLPSLEEQRRVARILGRLERVRLLRNESLSLLGIVGPSSFESLMEHGHGWPLVPLGDLVADSQLGLVRSAEQQNERWPYEYLKMNSITRNGQMSLGSLSRVRASVEEVSRYSVREGDLLFNTRNSRELVGKSAIYRGVPRLFNNNLMRLRFSGVLSTFVHSFLWSRKGRRELEARKSGTTNVFAIYAKDLYSIQIPVPPFSVQEKHRDVIIMAMNQIQLASPQIARLDLLKASVQQQEFARKL